MVTGAPAWMMYNFPWNSISEIEQVFRLSLLSTWFAKYLQTFSPFLKENYSLIYVLASSFEINMFNWAAAWFNTVQNTKRATKYDHVVERREAIHAMFTV